MFQEPLKFVMSTSQGSHSEAAVIKSHWHEALRKCFTEEYVKACKEKVQQLEEQAITAKVINSASTMLPHDPAFVWNPDGVQTFDVPLDLRFPVHVLRTQHCLLDGLWWPWKGIPMFVKVLVGPILVSILTEEQIIEAGSDLPGFLKTSCRLSQNQFFDVQAGDVIWIPAGRMPVFYGLSMIKETPFLTASSDLKRRMKVTDLPVEFVSFVCMLALDGKLIPSSVKSIMSGHLSLNLKSVPKSIKEHEKFGTFKAALDGV